MKRLLSANLRIFIILMLFFFTGCSGDKAQKVEIARYTCPMHPEVIKDEPGICPICKMDLEKINQNPPSDTLASLSKDLNSVDLKSVKVIHPKDTSIASAENVGGVIAYNTNSFRQVSSRISGRIEKLYVRYNYQPLAKGQKLMEIYSPEVASAAQELLFLRREGERQLLEAAKKKLYLLGISAAQVSAVLRTGKVDYSIAIYSPYQGFIAEQQPSETTSSSPGTTISSDNSGASMNAMGSGNTDNPPSQVPATNANTPLLLREGQYVSAGQKLFSIVNTAKVWAEFYVSPLQAKTLKPGTSVQIRQSVKNGRGTSGQVIRVQPFYSDGTSYIQVRALLPNANDNWKVGEQVKVELNSRSIAGRWVPKTAVLSLGSKNVVFLKEKGSFKPVYVNVMKRSDGFVNIGNSLRTDVELAANAWFMVDSESFIKPEKANEDD